MSTELATTQPATPMAMIQLAVESNADPERLEKLMDLQERWEAGNARKAFFQAMADFQSQCPAIPKDGEVKDRSGKLMYKFAKLETVLATVREVEQACGFRHRWDQVDLDNGGVKVTCHVTHIEGHAEETSVTIPPAKGINTNAAQDRGIIIKYGKRYSLLNAYGLEPDEGDTDGRIPGGDTVTPEQAVAIDSALAELDDVTVAKFYKWAGCETAADLPAAKYQDAMRSLRKKVADANR